MSTGSVPAGTKMPDPVPRGRFAEYAACIGEGFCPSCRRQFSDTWSPVRGITWGRCEVCACRWEYSRRAYLPQIGWRGEVDGTHWDIWVNDDRQFRAEWAELRPHPGALSPSL